MVNGRPPRGHLAATVALVAALGVACSPDAADSPSPALLFRDRTAGVGLDFRHDGGRSGKRYFVEPVGSGVALFDYDGDGDLDLWLVQGGGLTAAGAIAAGDRLLRNDLGAAGPRLVDVTVAATGTAIPGSGHGMGAHVGDADGDGDLDLLRTAFGRDELWRNAGDGSFSEVAAEAGIDDPRWTTGAAWLDADGDGDQDLYVAAYVDYRLATHLPCRNAGGRPDYCNPQRYSALPDRLYRNRGDGRFDEVGAAALRAAGGDATGRGLGVVSGDWNGDGATDLYVTNDLGANFLWQSSGASEPRFVDRGLVAGAALSPAGRAEASMGVESGDLDGDGDDDLLMTHLEIESAGLYRNEGGSFRDVRGESGLAAATRGLTGFGAALIDADADGSLDVAVANGAVTEIEALARRADPYPLGQRNLLLLQNRGRFLDASALAEGLDRLEVTRGLAAGDLDGDGDLDLLLTNNSGPARYLESTPPPAAAAAWVGVVVRRDAAAGAPATGTVVAARCAGTGEAWRVRRSRVDGSYLSSRDPRVVVALAGCARAEVELRAPQALRRLRAVPTGRYLVTAVRVAPKAEPGDAE